MPEQVLTDSITPVRLVAITAPVTAECSNAEELVAYCARVSAPNNQTNTATAGKLIRYLIRNNHWSPLEMVNITMEINTTRDIARQILRHRSFAFQEFSQRYATNLGFAKNRELRMQDSKNRQNSLETDNEQLRVEWDELQREVRLNTEEEYNWAIDQNIAKEQARVILPEGLTMSRMYMQGSLRSWIHYCMLRMGNGTQKEHREVAAQCWTIICKEFPSISDLFDPELEELVNNFAAKMKARLLDMKAEGKWGWNEGHIEFMKDRMIDNACRDQYVDTANFAMFLEAQQ